MAWTLVKEQGHLATSEVTETEKTATRVFVAVADAPTTTVAAETASHGGVSIPAANAAHPDDSTRKRKTVNAKPDPESNRTVFIVTANYSNKGTEQPENPLDRDPDISWDFDDATETYFIDETPEDDDGPLMVLNTAGQQFEEFLERETGSIKATVTRNIADGTYDPAVAVAYKDAVNDDEFEIDGKTIDIGQCKMKSYTCGPRQVENGVTFRVATWNLHFRESWDDEVDSRGYQSIVAGSDPLTVQDIKGKDGKTVDAPWPLDEDGISTANIDDDPHPLTFKPYKRDSFGDFDPLWAYA